jgi:ABC-type cobalamin/Fe3+-siderophores transport system ATPase subunit
MKLALKRVSATSGFLQDVQVEFVPGLNCIIGARGTCKTTLVESIRFAFDLNEHGKVDELTARADPSDRNSTEGLIRASLRAGVVRCDVSVDDSREQYNVTLERELDAPPRTYRDSVREYTSSELLGHIEVYSQGDLQRLAEDDEQGMRLDLIDRPQLSKIRKLQEERRSCIDKVMKIGPNLRSVRAEIQDRSRQVKGLVDLRHELKTLQQSRQAMPMGLEETFQGALRRKAILADLQEALKILDEAAEYVSGSSAYADRIRGLSDKLAAHKAAVLDGPVRKLREALETLVQCRTAAGNLTSLSLAEDYAGISGQFEAADNEYYKLRQEQQQLNESLKKEETLRTQIHHLEKLESALEESLSKEQRLLGERSDCRASISTKSDQIYTLRLAEIESVNKKHSDIILLTLTAGEQTGEYKDQLTQLLSRSRIKLQDEVAADISWKLKPAELIDLVEQGNSATLAEVLGRDVGQMMRLVAHLAEHPEFYKLEGSIFEDRLDVTMYDNGQPKKVETLSKGQKATALLPLILRPAPYPLVVDQPEDDLDNSFIYQSLVKIVMELKTERQLVFVTHNANIPVLGDAERVIVMSMASPSSAAPPKSGTVDDRKSEILDLLEGGKEAFSERERHYADLLGNGTQK